MLLSNVRNYLPTTRRHILSEERNINIDSRENLKQHWINNIVGHIAAQVIC
jgi:hypothetical protein